MTSLRWRTWWNAILGIALLSWIPLNLWLQRNNDSLIHAVILGNLDAAERAVMEGGNVHMPIRGQYTLLQVAALHTDNIAMAEFLVRHGVSPAATNGDGDSALVIAHRQGHEQIAAYLHSLTNQHKNSNQAATKP